MIFTVLGRIKDGHLITSGRSFTLNNPDNGWLHNEYCWVNLKRDRNGRYNVLRQMRYNEE